MKNFASAAALSLCSACGDGSTWWGTAVQVWTSFGPDVQISQLQFSGSSRGAPVFGPIVRPDAAAAPLPPGGALLVLLPDALDRSPVSCEVRGLSNGKVVAHGSGQALVSLGRISECAVWLAMDAPSTVCDASSCDGCCSTAGCQAGTVDSACGRRGVACTTCRADHAEVCVLGECRN
jgi:hypothetical protein